MRNPIPLRRHRDTVPTPSTGRPTRRIATLVGLLLLIASPSHAGTEPVTAVDLLRLRTVSAIDVARDGRVAIYAVRSIAPSTWRDEADESSPTEYRTRSHLWAIDLFDESAAPIQLTFGAVMDGAPVVAPDGRRVAFVRRTEGAPPRAHVIALDGGGAMPLASLPRGVGDVSWSPDGRRLLVTSSVLIGELEGEPLWPSERPGRAWNDEPLTGTASAPRLRTPSPAGNQDDVRAWLARNASEDDPTVINRLSFQGEQALRTEWSFDQLFLLSSSDPDAPPVQLTRSFHDHGSPRFLPDGRRIVYASSRADDTHPDRLLQRGLWTIAADGSDDQPLLAIPGWQLGQPQPSRDGSAIAFTGQRLDDPAYRLRMLGLVPVNGGEPLWLTEMLDRSVRRFQWQGSGPTLLFTVPDQGGFPLMAISPGLLEATTVVREQDGVPIGVHAFGQGGGTIVYAQTTPDAPCVLMAHDQRGPRRLADLNPWVEDRRIARPEPGWITRPDGSRVQYWIMEPAGRRPGQRVPLLLEIHGGPSAMWGPGELSMWHEFQMFASAGYGIVYSNPRGSGGYGYEFRRANRQDWGAGPAGDVLAATDEALRLDWVDPDRLVVTGGSYGGFLTAWIVTRDHRFRAAVCQRGVYHMDTFFGEGNAWRLVEWSFGGFPFDSRMRDLLDRNSPVLDARRIQTPVMVMHASQDLRTGVSQSEMLYRALKVLGKPVEYVRYPDAGHDLSRTGDPVQRLDRLLRIREFFERFIDVR